MTAPGALRGGVAARWCACLLVALAAGACGSGDGREAARAEKAAPTHVWKPQVDAYHKAQKVEGIMLDAAARQSEEIDRQAQ